MYFCESALAHQFGLVQVVVLLEVGRPYSHNAAMRNIIQKPALLEGGRTWREQVHFPRFKTMDGTFIFL